MDTSENQRRSNMKIVIFDMDGTLIDSQHDITVSINYIRQKHHNLHPLENDFVVDAINRDQRNLARLFYETEVYEERDRLLFEEHYYQQCIQNPRLYRGVETMLERLKRQDVKLSVATNAPTIFAERMLQHLNVAHHFDHIIGADKVSAPKPDKAMLGYILDQYNYVRHEDQAWMIGDNSKDMQAAENTEISGVFVTWGFSPKGLGRVVINEPEELFNIL